jgi:signal transduction histidine kinase
VLDEGPGIAAEMLPHIFERYVTGTSRTGGLGLGLYIAKRIADIHGGDLSVERRSAGGGTRFRLFLPLVPAESKAAAQPLH